jgi:hypothetical protein
MSHRDRRGPGTAIPPLLAWAFPTLALMPVAVETTPPLPVMPTATCDTRRVDYQMLGVAELVVLQSVSDQCRI